MGGGGGGGGGVSWHLSSYVRDHIVQSRTFFFLDRYGITQMPAPPQPHILCFILIANPVLRRSIYSLHTFLNRFPLNVNRICLHVFMKYYLTKKPVRKPDRC